MEVDLIKAECHATLNWTVGITMEHCTRTIFAAPTPACLFPLGIDNLHSHSLSLFPPMLPHKHPNPQPQLPLLINHKHFVS